ncbi:ATP-binding protein [Natrialba aegyptia]|uniref:histidine kinase n=1 Tax=Natrialba aegyptia DSM 13077 TaxID=1227491 RepID=M0BDL0_9EURY|nr:ATP-binding protein [Natrialba aegyptia]ELZ08981.1 multi-sensor signal transduction histidine kinase [Natrialba aegyptia DSM 13077]
MGAAHLGDSVAQLGRLATDLEACESVAEVYTRAISGVDRIIEFDAASICTVEDGAFEPQAANTAGLIPAEPLAADAGIAGKTYREDRTYVVDDLTTAPDAAPTSDAFRSVLSIPLEFGGVVQFHATEPAAFSEADRHLGELFVATVTNARNRVTYQSALETERDQFAALFENVPDAALQYRIEDGTQLVDAINSAFIRVFGYDAADAVGEPLTELLLPARMTATEGADTTEGTGPGTGTETEPKPESADTAGVPGQERTRAQTQIQTQTQTQSHPTHLVETELTERADVEVVRETADGPRPFLLRNIPVATTDGTTRGYLIYTDLTELKLRERELQRKNERLDQFASIVSHDLRNPLGVADGYLELALQKARESQTDEAAAAPTATAELEEIQRAHDRMKRLIEDVLTMARGKRVEDPPPVDIDTIATTAWNNVDTDTASLEATSDTQLAADRGRLLQLFENLFRNAIEHAGPAVSVRVDSLPNGFAVEDDGPGIPPGERDSVLEPGQSSTADNTGLGLAIVAQIAAEHGWTLDLSSAANTADTATPGARFEFSEASSPLERPSELDRERGSGAAFGSESTAGLVDGLETRSRFEPESDSDSDSGSDSEADPEPDSTTEPEPDSGSPAHRLKPTGEASDGDGKGDNGGGGDGDSDGDETEDEHTNATGEDTR